MEKFLKQFKLTPMQRIMFESFIFRAADRNIKGYMGGSWESMELAPGIVILLIPAKDDEQVTLTVELSGNTVTTDRVTASAAFTSLVANWFWHTVHGQASMESNMAFEQQYHGLRNAVYDDTTHNINTDDYYTLTD